jgi:hypothetical protein
MAKKKENSSNKPVKRHKNHPKGAYDPAINDQVRYLCARGFINNEIAKALGVGVSTLEGWIRNNEELREAMEKGKSEADDLVEQSLFKAATGYKIRDTYFTQYQGAIISEEYDKEVGPNVTAAIFWLKNRRRAQWADVHNVNHKHSGEVAFRHIEDIPIEELTEEQQELIFQTNLKQLGDGRDSN